jgi:hypothetical protein
MAAPYVVKNDKGFTKVVVVVVVVAVVEEQKFRATSFQLTNDT